LEYAVDFSLVFSFQAIDVETLREACLRYILDRQPTVAAVGPTEGLPEYNVIRSAMHWLGG
jgi:processing peptidase subunit beta